MTNPRGAIKPGCEVCLHYALASSDGTEFLTTFGDEPLVFTIGDGSIDAGLESLLFELEAGDERVFHLEPGQAFGIHDESMIHWLARSDFPPEIPLEIGNLVEFCTPAGDEIAGLVLEIDDNRVRIDFNHPLAGRAVLFRVRILSIGAD